MRVKLSGLEMGFGHVEAVVRGFFLGHDLDVAGLGESPLGNHWTRYFVYEDRKKYDIPDKEAIVCA